MANGPLVVTANFCNPLDDRALSKNVFPLFRLCPTASHIHPDFPLLFHLMYTSAFVGSNLPTRRDCSRFARHSGKIAKIVRHGPVYNRGNLLEQRSGLLREFDPA